MGTKQVKAQAKEQVPSPDGDGILVQSLRP